MNNLSDYINSPSKKHISLLMKLCRPIFKHLNIDTLWRVTISEKGEYTFLGNSIEMSEYFWSNPFYNHPFFKHPKYFRNKFCLPDKAHDEMYDSLQSKINNKFSMHNNFVLFEGDDENLIAYNFASTKNGIDLTNTYLSNLHIIRKFIKYYENEISSITNKLTNHSLDIASLCGEEFYKPSKTSKLIAGNSSLQILDSLFPEDSFRHKILSSLSNQEKRIIKLLLKGYTFTQIGKELFRSPRTIEHNIEALKDKFAFQSKSELISYLSDFRNMFTGI